MSDLRQILRSIFQNRFCLVGVGNVDWGDDGLGVRLAEALRENPGLSHTPLETATSGEVGRAVLSAPLDRPRHSEDTAPYQNSEIASLAAVRPAEFDVLVAGTEPERYVGQLADGRFDHVLFVDAVDVGGAPGSAVLLNAGEIARRHPQVSTHKISIGLLASMIEANGTTRAWLLGVQPQSLQPDAGLSPAIRATLEALRSVMVDLWTSQASPGNRGLQSLVTTSSPHGVAEGLWCAPDGWQGYVVGM